LTKAKDWAKRREVTDRHDPKEVEKQDYQNCIDKSEEENRLSQRTNGERGNNHVRSKPLDASQYVEWKKSRYT
jgi:hypothetical protein